MGYKDHCNKDSVMPSIKYVILADLAFMLLSVWIVPMVIRRKDRRQIEQDLYRFHYETKCAYLKDDFLEE